MTDRLTPRALVVRGQVDQLGTNDLSLPHSNLLRAIGIPLIVLAILEKLHTARQRRMGNPRRRRSPPPPDRGMKLTRAGRIRFREYDDNGGSPVARSGPIDYLLGLSWGRLLRSIRDGSTAGEIGLPRTSAAHSNPLDRPRDHVGVTTDPRLSLFSASSVQHSSGVVISPVAPADPVVTGGRIWTKDPARPWAEALAATNGLIAAVGDAAKVSALVAPVPRNS
jgi:hypothetical protein